MMRNVTLIILLTFVALVHAKVVATNRTVDPLAPRSKLVEKIFKPLVNRALNVQSLHRNLDSTTLLKPGNLLIPSAPLVQKVPFQRLGSLLPGLRSSFHFPPAPPSPPPSLRTSLASFFPPLLFPVFVNTSGPLPLPFATLASSLHCSPSFSGSAVEENYTNASSRPIDEILPIYHTFEEFLEYPLAKRHATPIRSIEFDFLSALCNEADQSWTKSINEADVKIQRKWNSLTGIPLLRGFVEFPDIDPNVILYNLVDVRARLEWDDFACFENVEEGVRSSNNDILYFSLPAPVIKNRDFCVYRRVRAETTTRGEGYSIMSRSTTHASKPELKQDYVRGEVHIGGIRLYRPAGSTTTQFSIASMGDPCGIIPKWLVSRYAVMKLHDNVKALRTASVKVQAALSKDPALVARVSEVVARFQEQK